MSWVAAGGEGRTENDGGIPTDWRLSGNRPIQRSTRIGSAFAGWNGWRRSWQTQRQWLTGDRGLLWNTQMGRFCFLCGHIRANEAFGGKGERARICRKCRRLPRETRDIKKAEYEICSFLDQSRISEKNTARLRSLARSPHTRIADLAAVVLEVALAASYRRRRIRILARERPDVLRRMEAAGLIQPRVQWGDEDMEEIDAAVAWYEWVESAEAPCFDDAPVEGP